VWPSCLQSHALQSYCGLHAVSRVTIERFRAAHQNHGCCRKLLRTCWRHVVYEKVMELCHMPLATFASTITVHARPHQPSSTDRHVKIAQQMRFVMARNVIFSTVGRRGNGACRSTETTSSTSPTQAKSMMHVSHIKSSTGIGL